MMGIFMNSLALSSDTAEQLITHGGSDCILDISSLRSNLENKENLALPLDEEKDMLDQLFQFELGRFLLENKGLNGFWTAYIIIHGPKLGNLQPLEEWFLKAAPTVRATQERFGIFQQILQANLKDDMAIASVPCGLMDDLLRLDYSNVKGIHLTGIDLDPASIKLAKEQAISLGFKNVNFIQHDAWNLGISEKFDMLTSNGLNIYEQNDDAVVILYTQFCNALKKDGILITSFLTPPPVLSKESTWNNVNVQDALKQKAIFSDIIGATWQAFRTEKKTREQLESAGFDVIDVIYDAQGIFPTVIAKKK